MATMRPTTTGAAAEVMAVARSDAAAGAMSVALDGLPATRRLAEAVAALADLRGL